jgi:hypothetical protein
MEKKSKTQYSWFAENGDCHDVFDSVEEAIEDAQHRYDEEWEEFEYRDEVLPVAYIGPVKFFNMENAVKTIVEGIEDNIGDMLYEFIGACDFDAECYVSKKDKDAFVKEATQALLPIVKKYVCISPQYICTPTGQYDLKNKNWIELC